MPSRTPIRNRLAKRLPDTWRRRLLEQGAPRRKYTALCSALLADGRRIERLVIEEGWIIATDPAILADSFEERIDFDPSDLQELSLLQII